MPSAGWRVEGVGCMVEGGGCRVEGVGRRVSGGRLSGNLHVSFKNLHEKYYTNSSGRDLCLAFFCWQI